MIIDSGIVTGSFQVIGNTEITGSLEVTEGITGSLKGNAESATSSSYALSASYAQNVPTAISASYALSASSVPYSGLTGTIPTWNQNTTGTAATASYVQNAVSASYALNATNAVNASSATSASYALNATNAASSISASNAVNADTVDGRHASEFVLNSATSSLATQTYVNTAVSNLVDAAPGTLDTLNELAAALGDDPNFATTVATSIGTKQNQLNGTGFVKASGTTISYDNSTYTPTSRTLTINGTSFDLSADRSWSIAAGVTSFNTRTGGITLTSGDVTTALGYTPYNATNPNGYTTNTGTVTSVGGTGTVSGLTLSGTVTSTGNLTLGGTLSLTSGNVTTALGYTPYNATNPNGYISSYTETDPTVPSHVKAITTTNISNWNTAFSWGNHAGLYMTQGQTRTDINSINNGGNRYDPSVNNPTNEHYAVLTYGNGGNVTGQLATHFVNGNLYSRGYNSTWSSWRRYWNDTDFTNSNISNWNTAFGWGNHAGLYLGINSKAADSELLDGVDSTRVIFGDNSTGTISITDTTLNGALKSGFYTVGSGGIPNATSVNFVLHTAFNGVGNLAGFDLACNDSTTSQFYLRPATGGGKGSWQTLVTSTNVGSFAVPTSRTLTINGTTLDLSANRSFTVTASETDTLATVTGRGATTTTLVQLSNQGAFNTTTPGLGNYGLHFTGQTTGDFANGMTWNGGTGTTGAQAGIYVQGSGAYGTRMFIATTDSYATGARTAVRIDEGGNVNITRGVLQQGGVNVVTNNSGTWSINITGNAATATSATSAGSATNATNAGNATFVNSPDGDRVAGNKLPTSNARTVRFDFATAGSVTGATGNYAGVMTYAPWDGTSTSTGDSSYQLAFANQSGVNAGGPAQLLLRNGINSTWNSWQTILSTSNFNSYSPTLTGTGASGTWGINITGTAGSAPNGSNANSFYNVTPGDGNGVRFWESHSYKISMGVGGLYQYGPVTDYSIKMQMDQGSTGRGFTWGREGIAPIAGLNSTSGDMRIAGNFTTNQVQFATSINGGRFNGDNSWGAKFFTSDGYIWFGPANGGHAHIYTDRPNFYFNTQLTVNGGSQINTNDIRANIFYDQNDTNYYADFNSTSDNAIRVRGGALHGPNPTWGAFLLVGGDGRNNYINSGVASVCATNGNLHLDAGSGYETYINYYDGNNIYFGGGANNVVGLMNSSGTITFAGDVVAFGSPSDINLKTIKEKIPNALSSVLKLNGYRFDWKDEEGVLKIKEDIGVIAQEVQEVFPELTRINENGYMSVRHQGLTAVLIEAIKEQQTQIDELKDLVKQLTQK